MLPRDRLSRDVSVCGYTPTHPCKAQLQIPSLGSSRVVRSYIGASVTGILQGGGDRDHPDHLAPEQPRQLKILLLLLLPPTSGEIFTY